MGGTGTVSQEAGNSLEMGKGRPARPGEGGEQEEEGDPPVPTCFSGDLLFAAGLHYCIAALMASMPLPPSLLPEPLIPKPAR